MKNEEQLIQRIHHGDTESYRPLVERYQTGLIIYLENIFHDRAAAEDVAQESFIKAYLNIKQFSSARGKFSTWLYKIATNMARDKLRKDKRQFNPDDLEKYCELVTNEIDFIEIERIRRAVECLEPPILAHVIKQYFFEGKSYTQIAENLTLNVNTVASHIRRAKAKLKRSLE
ncbi:sigma-70 family RNA polymerase sigma factor [Candidatus Saccharibacteria bacterium]|nr:sigma-70 family RNA polymerase sigma factor [Candidatus Saccharibacteria bacterium]